MENTGIQKHRGSCHCGAVRFEVDLDPSQGSRCNCSVCTKISSMNAIVKPEALTVLAGEDSLTAYEWGGRTAKRYFCQVCGATCFGRGYLEQVGGAYASINLNCLDDFDPEDVKVVYWDGRHNNWGAGSRDIPWPVKASDS